MYRYFVQLTDVLLQSTFAAFFTMSLAHSAHSEGLGFVDMNQSRQFFQEGRRNVEREIDHIEREQDLKLPEIKLRDNHLQDTQQLDDSSLIDREIRPISRFTPNKYQYVEYSGVGLLTK